MDYNLLKKSYAGQEILFWDLVNLYLEELLQLLKIQVAALNNEFFYSAGPFFMALNFGILKIITCMSCQKLIQFYSTKMPLSKYTIHENYL